MHFITVLGLFVFASTGLAAPLGNDNINVDPLRMTTEERRMVNSPDEIGRGRVPDGAEPLSPPRRNNNNPWIPVRYQTPFTNRMVEDFKEIKNRMGRLERCNQKRVFKKIRVWMEYMDEISDFRFWPNTENNELFDLFEALSRIHLLEVEDEGEQAELRRRADLILRKLAEMEDKEKRQAERGENKCAVS